MIEKRPSECSGVDHGYFDGEARDGLAQDTREKKKNNNLKAVSITKQKPSIAVMVDLFGGKQGWVKKRKAKCWGGKVTESHS